MDRLPKPAKLLSPRTVVAILGVWLLATAFQRDRGEAWAEKTLEALSLRDKIAQLVQIRVPGTFTNRRSPEFRRIASDIREHHVGGLVLFAGDIYESAVLLNELQGLSRLPLLGASDFERGAAFRISDTTLGDGSAWGDDSFFVFPCRESRALGVHWSSPWWIKAPRNPVIIPSSARTRKRSPAFFIHPAQIVTANFFFKTQRLG
jgi:hypothetical protein